MRITLISSGPVLTDFLCSARHGLLTEGDTVQFKCNAHANPHPTEYTWFVDGQRANGFESDYFIITNISQSYHNSIVKCEVRNEIGKSEETETIQVRCKSL